MKKVSVENVTYGDVCSRALSEDVVRILVRYIHANTLVRSIHPSPSPNSTRGQVGCDSPKTRMDRWR
ncbi:hypothetical protein LLE49_09135 [Alicyclobacillus tolerans]|uniref:hypothetical protein n=1 Tax=Alicyclobacillus tolerans TaxID=90970 RepID=UPI001F308A9F|nr:hypothetical protein [Alicyclobacillus tolerans]MCF8564881.1 hypothetical protein [Alicyclobacillus tolerans]